jgi:hypothetical protein
LIVLLAVLTKAGGAIRRTGPRDEEIHMGQIGPLVRIIDTIEPIIGFRNWRVYAAGDLHSFTARDRWTPGADFAACCTARPDEAVPHRDCVCGVHAFRELRYLRPRALGTAVAGAVALWGRIVEHDLGFRAEHARPVALVESHYAQRVADVYGLPVLSRESLELEAGEALLLGRQAGDLTFEIDGDDL